MATIVHVFLRADERWHYGLSTDGSEDVLLYFAGLPAYVGRAPSTAFHSWIAWRASLPGTRALLKYPSAIPGGIRFTGPAYAIAPHTAERLADRVAHLATQAAESHPGARAQHTRDCEAYLIGYGHSSTTVLVDLHARVALVRDGDGQWGPLDTSHEYAHACRDTVFVNTRRRPDGSLPPAVRSTIVRSHPPDRSVAHPARITRVRR